MKHHFIEVTHASYIKDYIIEVQFNDGKQKQVNLYSLLFERSMPVFMPLRNIDLFRKFIVTDTIEWNNGTIDIAPEYLYNA